METGHKIYTGLTPKGDLRRRENMIEQAEVLSIEWSQGQRLGSQSERKIIPRKIYVY